jgi:DNA adenine methylase
LNKSCFNGLFRVNKQGQFNVPYGKLETLALPTLEHLNEASKIIKRAEVRACSFEVALENASKDCFFYLDPPYPPLNGTAYFTHYTADRFNNAQQEQLAEHVHVLDRRGAKVMITNADTPMIRQLYSKYNQRDVPVFRFVTCKRKRHVVRELIITNY